MKRFLTLSIIALALLIVTPPPAVALESGFFPHEFYGVQLFGIEEETRAIYISAWNNPWSMPNIYGMEVPAYARITQGAAFLQFSSGTYHLAWTPNCQCYATWTSPTPDTIRFSVFVGDLVPANPTQWWTGRFYQGELVFTGHPPQFWTWSPTAPGLFVMINPQGPPVLSRRPIPDSEAE